MIRPSLVHCCWGIHWFGVVQTTGVGVVVGDGVGVCVGVGVASGIHVFDAWPEGPVPHVFEGTTEHVYVWFASATNGACASFVVWEYTTTLSVVSTISTLYDIAPVLVHLHSAL